MTIAEPKDPVIRFIDKERNRVLYESSIPYGFEFKIDIWADSKQPHYLLVDQNGMAIGFKIDDGGYGVDGEHKEYFSRVITKDVDVECEMLRFDYYFDNLDEFRNQRDQIYIDNNNDLSKKVFGFSDFVGRDPWHSTAIQFKPSAKAPKMIVNRTRLASDTLLGLYSDSTVNITTEIDPKIIYYMPKIRSVEGMFYGVSVSTIPDSLFINNKEIEYAKNLFGGSTIETIPNNLFKNNPKIKNMNGMFYKTKRLTHVPHDLLNNIEQIDDISRLFYGSNIESIHKDFFKTVNSNYSLETAESAFMGCDNLIDIPEELFDTFSKIDNINSLFSSSDNLKTVNIEKVISKLNYKTMDKRGASSIFSNCRKLVGRGIDIDAMFPDKTTEDAFKGCYNLVNFFALPIYLTKSDDFWRTVLATKAPSDKTMFVGDSMEISVGDFTIESLTGVDYEFSKTILRPSIEDDKVISVELVDPDEGSPTVSNFFKIKITALSVGSSMFSLRISYSSVIPSSTITVKERDSINMH